MNGSSGAAKMAERLLQTKEDLEKLIDNLRSEDDVALVKGGLSEQVNSLPSTPEPPKKRQDLPMDLIRYRNCIGDIKKILVV